MKRICNERECTGCGACINICPKQCILFEENIYGEMHPVIDNSLCINCGKCERVCKQRCEVVKYRSVKCYASTTRNINERKDSASGGIAASIYRDFLKRFPNGFITGVMYNEEMKPLLSISNIDSIYNIDKYRGSKYVQASTEFVYVEIGELLKTNPVLFVGTPCQVAACKSFILEMNYNLDNLYTVDLICHGVAPYAYFRENLNYYKKRNNLDKVTNITFRSNRPLRNFHFVIEGEANNNKKIINVSSVENLYFYGFLRGIILRESCYNCSYACQERTGDLTIGDFIGYNPLKISKFDTDKNISLVLCNSKKGEEILKATNSIILEERSLEEAYKSSISLNRPFPVAKEREKYIEFYPVVGFDKSMRKVVGIQYKLKLLNAFLRRIIKVVVYKIKNIYKDNGEYDAN